LETLKFGKKDGDERKKDRGEMRGNKEGRDVEKEETIMQLITFHRHNEGFVWTKESGIKSIFCSF
jgi:hypothetical protein